MLPPQVRRMLDYATPPQWDSTAIIARHLQAMRFWRATAAMGIAAALVGIRFPPVLPILGGALAIAASTLTLFHMTQAAWRAMGRSYALRHLILAIAISPMFFIGVFLVPPLVEVEISRQRQREQQQHQ